MFASNVWTGGSASAGQILDSTATAVKWSNRAMGRPIEDVKSAITAIHLKTGYRPNRLLINRKMLDALELSDDIYITIGRRCNFF